MDEQAVLQILGRVGAVITDSHFVYTSWRHGSAYTNKDALYPHTAKTSLLCREMAKWFANDDVQVVIAPAIGGVILSQWTAFHLSELTSREVLGVYADRAKVDGENVFAIKRGYDKLIEGKKVLVVEDLLTTGGSVYKVVVAVRAAGGKILGVGILCNRGGVTSAALGGVPKLFALANVQMDTWDEKECPLCAKGVPINTDVGHGREFLAKRQPV
ncbi:phosphoribosyltransferase [Candidatus Kaiserbacteria bacterium]|nr:phosphoribosyltransferase [Candidatus Kaiserbacteria bacterium]